MSKTSYGSGWRTDVENQSWQWLEDGCRKPVMAVVGGRMSKTSYGSGWRTDVENQLWQWLEDGCRKPVLGACAPHSEHHFPAPSSKLGQN